MSQSLISANTEQSCIADLESYEITHKFIEALSGILQLRFIFKLKENGKKPSVWATLPRIFCTGGIQHRNHVYFQKHTVDKILVKHEKASQQMMLSKHLSHRNHAVL